MRLLLATPLFPPDIGGPATYAKLLVDELPAKNIEVQTVTFSDVLYLPKVIRHIAYFLRVRAALKNVDAVLALDPVSVGLPAYVAGLLMRKPCIVKIVGDYAWEQGQQRFGITDPLDVFVLKKEVPFFVRVLRKIQEFVAHHATAIIVPSEYLKRIVIAWGVSPEKITVIYNAVPLGTLGVVPDAVSHLPPPIIVAAGRLVPWKNISGIIDAVALLRAEGMTASVVIVGNGPRKDMLMTEAKEKLRDGYVFTGALSHDDTLATIQRADAFVLNSSYEGLSHLLIEALQLHLPVVATDIGGNPEVITHQESGLLISVGDITALAAAVRRICTEEGLRAYFRRGMHASSERFALATMLTRTSDLLLSV